MDLKEMTKKQFNKKISEDILSNSSFVICELCGEKIIDGVIPFVKHQDVCLGNKTEDVDFEIIEPKQLAYNDSQTA